MDSDGLMHCQDLLSLRDRRRVRHPRLRPNQNHRALAFSFVPAAGNCSSTTYCPGSGCDQGGAAPARHVRMSPVVRTMTRAQGPLPSRDAPPPTAGSQPSTLQRHSSAARLLLGHLLANFSKSLNLLLVQSVADPNPARNLSKDLLHLWTQQPLSANRRRRPQPLWQPCLARRTASSSPPAPAPHSSMSSSTSRSPTVRRIAGRRGAFLQSFMVKLRTREGGGRTHLEANLDKQ